MKVDENIKLIILFLFFFHLKKKYSYLNIIFQLGLEI